MNRHLISRRLCCLVISLLFITCAATAAPSDEEREEAGRNFASITVGLDAHGSTVVYMSVSSTRPIPAGLEEKLDEALGVRLQKFRPEGLEGLEDYQDAVGEDRGWRTFFGRADGAFARSGLLVSGRLDFAPFAAELRALGVTDLNIMLSIPGANGFAEVTGTAQCNPTIKDFYCSRINLETDSPALISFTFGYRLRDVLLKWLPLAVFLLLPVGLTLWMRRAVLRARREDASASWFGYFRFLHLTVMGTWLLWLPLYSWADPDEIFRFLSDSGLNTVFGAAGAGSRAALPLAFEAIKLGLYLIPPALVTVLCHLLSHKVFTEVRGMEWSPAEVARQALWTQAAALVPLFFLLIGLTSLNRHASLAAACFILAFVTWQLCARLSSKAQKWAPRALTTGELRDRIFALAGRAGVPLKQIYILPAGKGQLANAFARSDNSIMLTDSLLRHLSGREVEGIVAHELAHLKESHPRSLGVIFVSTIVVATIIAPQLADAISLERWAPALFSAAVGAAMLLTHYVQRGYERHADALAITLTGDPEAFITGLARLAQLNVMPVHWGTWDEKWSTHPSTQQRAQRLAEYSGIGPERLRELLELARTDNAPQPETPPVVEAETEKVFSTAFKTNMAQRTAWAILAVVSSTPVLVAWLLGHWRFAGAAQWLVYGAGLVAAFCVYQFVRNYVAVWGYGALRTGLRAKMERAGFRTQDGVVVGFAPAAEPRVYENQYIWDAGYLFLTSGRLCYVGEETNFALSREQVVATYLGDGPLDWFKRPTLYVRWQDRERDTGGVFYLFPGEARSLWQSRRASAALYRQVRSWLEEGATFPAPTEQLDKLAAPAYGHVTSTSPAAMFSMGKVVNGMVVLLVFTSILGVALGFTWASLGYAMFLTISICLLDTAPRLFQRQTTDDSLDSPAKDGVEAGELSSYQRGAWAETET